MKGGSFILNWIRGITTPENKELNEDLKTFSTYKNIKNYCGICCA